MSEEGAGSGSGSHSLSLRDDMVKRAVAFLQHPSAVSETREKKREFLLQKGLKEVEIDEAERLAKEEVTKAIESAFSKEKGGFHVVVRKGLMIASGPLILKGEKEDRTVLRAGLENFESAMRKRGVPKEAILSIEVTHVGKNWNNSLEDEWEKWVPRCSASVVGVSAISGGHKVFVRATAMQ